MMCQVQRESQRRSTKSMTRSWRSWKIISKYCLTVSPLCWFCPLKQVHSITPTGLQTHLRLCHEANQTKRSCLHSHHHQLRQGDSKENPLQLEEVNKAGQGRATGGRRHRCQKPGRSYRSTHQRNKTEKKFTRCGKGQHPPGTQCPARETTCF